jgi:predicted PurR-regulated permease PerM
MSAFSTLISRHWRTIVFILGLIFIFWFIWALRSVFMPFVIGFILAYMLLPIIRWVEKRVAGVGKKLKHKQLIRISIIFVVYLLSLAVVGLIIFYIIAVMGKSLLSMAGDITQIIPNGLDALTNWLKSLPVLSSPAIQQQIDAYSVQAGAAAGDAAKGFLTNGWGFLQSSLGTILGYVILPIFIFYILKDWDRLRDKFYAALPLWTRKHTKGMFSILQNVVGRYVRGQLLLGFAVGLCAFILLMILKIPFALPLAFFAGLTEMVPMIGPWIGGGLAVLVALATSPEKVIWVALGYVVIQLLENNLLVPKIQGSQMQIHPAFVIILSLLGAHFAGILGFIIALPLTMIIIEAFKYFRNSNRNSESNTS